MRKYIFYSFIISLGFLAWSCNEQEVIVPKVTAIKSDRVVLIEDFTGVKCPNCPSASRKIEQLSELYPGKVVSIAYHTDFLGDPITHPEEYKSKYDFRTATGNKLEEIMGYYLGKPAVTLDRQKHSPEAEFLLDQVEALGNIETELNSAPKVDITINNQFNDATRVLNCEIKIKALEEISGAFHLHAVISEDHILDSQLDNDKYVNNYEHNHVFRALLSDINGDLLGDKITKDQVITKNYSFTLPAEAGWWNAANCHVVAFLSDYTKKPSIGGTELNVGYVLQAGTKGLK
jgi:thiol-disulfide isomerase/thioredoxin